MSDISAALLVKALDGLAQRYLFTSQNIANANSPDYQPVQVSFEDRLRAAASQGLDAVRSVEPEVIATPRDAQTGPMRLDLELASASQTAMRYRALIEILGQQLALQRAVAMSGDR